MSRKCCLIEKVMCLYKVKNSVVGYCEPMWNKLLVSFKLYFVHNLVKEYTVCA